MSRTFGIGDLSREFAVTPRTIRHYEDEGLLTPLRAGQRRIYRPRDRTRLKLILRGRRLGFPLAQIREIVDLYDGPSDGEARQLQLLIERIEQRSRELREKREDIDQTLRDLAQVAAGCHARLEEMASSSAAAARDRKTRSSAGGP